MDYEDFEFLQSILGEEAQTIEIEVNGHKWQGLGLIDYPNGSLSYSQALYIEELRPSRINLIRENWRACHDRNICLWSNTGIDLHAVVAMPVLDILSYAQVGHIQYLGEENPQKTWEVMNAINSVLPFEITSASDEYLEACFIDLVNLDQAKVFQGILMDLTLEVLNDAYFMVYETDNPGFSDQDVVAKAIVKNQGFWLNWG